MKYLSIEITKLSDEMYGIVFCNQKITLTSDVAARFMTRCVVLDKMSADEFNNICQQCELPSNNGVIGFIALRTVSLPVDQEDNALIPAINEVFQDMEYGYRIMSISTMNEIMEMGIAVDNYANTNNDQQLQEKSTDNDQQSFDNDPVEYYAQAMEVMGESCAIL